MPFSKMVGLEVTPLRPSCSNSSRILPSSSRSRFRLSIQIACPSASISRNLLLMLNLLYGRRDRFGVDARFVDQLFRRSPARHGVHCQLTHRAERARARESVQHGVAEAALALVVAQLLRQLT